MRLCLVFILLRLSSHSVVDGVSMYTDSSLLLVWFDRIVKRRGTVISLESARHDKTSVPFSPSNAIPDTHHPSIKTRQFRRKSRRKNDFCQLHTHSLC